MREMGAVSYEVIVDQILKAPLDSWSCETAFLVL